MWNVPAFFGVVLATVGNSNTNKLYLPPGLFGFFFIFQFSISWFLTNSFFPPSPIYFRSVLINRSCNRQGNESSLAGSAGGWSLFSSGVMSGRRSAGSCTDKFIAAFFLLVFLSLVPQHRWAQGWEQYHINDGKLSQAWIFPSFSVHFSCDLLFFFKWLFDDWFRLITAHEV